MGHKRRCGASRWFAAKAFYSHQLVGFCIVYRLAAIMGDGNTTGISIFTIALWPYVPDKASNGIDFLHANNRGTRFIYDWFYGLQKERHTAMMSM